MDSMKNVCRICLERKEYINWNDDIKASCGISYKDCYYKYTQLEKPDADCYPTNLCERCANELKAAHIFFEHALESFKILQNISKAKEISAENNSQGVIVCENFDNSFIEGKEHYDIDEVICYSPVTEDVDTGNELKEIVYEQNSRTSLEIPTEQLPIDNNFIKILNSSLENQDSRTKKEYHELFETTLELNLQLEIHGSNLLKSSAKKSSNKLSPSLHQSLTKKHNKYSKKLVPHQTVQCKVKSERVQNSNKLCKNTEPFQADLPDVLEEDIIDPIEQSLLEENAGEISTDDTVPINIEIPKARELHKLSVAKRSVRKRSELEEYLLFMQSLNKSDINSLTSSITHLKSKRFQKPSIPVQNKPSEGLVIPLSEERFGNTADENSLSVCKPQKQKETMCQYCSKVFISIYKAIEHEKTHLENRERNETCSKCGLKFYNKNALRSHMYTHKENREKNLKCEFCGKAFYNNNGLSIHRKIHVGPKIPCSICSKEYYRQSDLDKHMVSHSATRVDGDLKYRKKYFVYCEICGNEVRSVDYKSHIAKHNNEPLAKCAICNKEFFSRKSCISHLKSVHRKKSGERSNFAISYKTKYYSKLFLQQKTGTLFTKEKV